MRRGEPLWREQGAPRELDVVGLGQITVDSVCVADALPPPGGKERAREYALLPGGQVATAVLACARLGLRCAYLGSVGDDPAGELALEPLRAGGVDTSGVRRAAGTPTHLALIWVDGDTGERTILWYRDPRLALDPSQLRRADIERARALHVDAGDPEAAAWAARTARAAGIPVTLDADAGGPGVGELLKEVDFPIVSREFAQTFYATSSVREALEGLVSGGARMAVVTLGEHGALARAGDRVIESPPYPVRARDTTGAGDVFHAGFVWALLEGHDAQRALAAANAAAAMNCRGLGAQGGLPTRAELEAFLASTSPAPWRDP